MIDQAVVETFHRGGDVVAAHATRLSLSPPI
jgi:hypothetical protein